MKRVRVFLLVLVFAVFAGCKEKNPAAIKNGELTVCYKSMLKDTVNIPLSSLTEDLQIVKLDDAETAIVKDNGVLISDNYILVFPSGSIPAKLFDRKTGKYIANVGSVGQGPGEYSQPVYHVQIDEKGGRIYFLTFNARQLLSYDLQGQFKEAININAYVPKCIFKVNSADSVITFATLPFQGMKTLVWKVRNNETIQRYPVGHLSVKVDFSNEIIGGFNDENVFDFYILNFFNLKSDSLYHYDAENNKLTPVFTIDFGNSPIPIHSYRETPGHYMGTITEAMKTVKTEHGEASTTIDNYFIVDKKSLKASYFRLKNDFLGDIEIGAPVWFFSNGYFSYNYDPSVLLEQLENTLASNKKLSEKMRAKLTELKNSINESKDNNYILYAKLKKYMN
jgi:hypothetical protein